MFPRAILHLLESDSKNGDNAVFSRRNHAYLLICLKQKLSFKMLTKFILAFLLWITVNLLREVMCVPQIVKHVK